MDWSIRGRLPHNGFPFEHAVGVYVGHSALLGYPYGSISGNGSISHGSSPSGVRLLSGWLIASVAVTMLVMVCVQALHRLWALLVQACNLDRLEDKQPGEESFDLDRFGQHLEGPTAAFGTVTGRILSNAGRGNCC